MMKIIISNNHQMTSRPILSRKMQIRRAFNWDWTPANSTGCSVPSYRSFYLTTFKSLRSLLFWSSLVRTVTSQRLEIRCTSTARRQKRSFSLKHHWLSSLPFFRRASKALTTRERSFSTRSGSLTRRTWPIWVPNLWIHNQNAVKKCRERELMVLLRNTETRRTKNFDKFSTSSRWIWG